MTILIKNAQIVDDGMITAGSILAEDGVIRQILPPDTTVSADTVIDALGQYASPGFIDSHTHGAGGYDFMDGTTEAYVGACRMHLMHGTTTILPTSLASSTRELLRSVVAFKEAREIMKDEMNLEGMHLEGPYFAMNQKGGQDPRYIKDPDPAEYKEVVAHADGNIRRWSIAPELPGAMDMADYLVANSIIPTIAHTDATYDVVLEGLKHGFRHITHLYSCTSTITRRSGFRVMGVTECAYAIDELTAELIADGCHLPPELLRMIIKCKPVSHLSLITDSLRPAGLDVKTTIIGSREDGREVIIEDGVAKMPDRTAFAGSIATTDRLVRTVWKRAGIPLTDTIRMMCENPAKLLRVEKTKGRLAPGFDADIVVFDENVHVRHVIYRGRKVN